MVKMKRQRRSWSSTLILLGLLAALGLAGCQNAQPTAKVEQTPLPTSTATAIPPTATPTAAPPTVAPSPTAAPPTQAPAPTVAPTLIPVAAAPAPAVTPLSASAAAPVRLVISDADLKIDARVVEMGWQVVQTANGPRSDWVIPKNEAGHHINSVGLGEQGNVVISGHNNIYGRVFRPISLAWDDDKRTKVDDFTDQSDVLNGRTIQLFNARGQAFSYVITAFYRLKDTGVSLQQRIANARFIEPTAEAQLTLVTCWPPSSNTHRLIVIARPVQ